MLKQESATLSHRLANLIEQAVLWSVEKKIVTRAPFYLVIFSLVAVLLTYGALTRAYPLGGGPEIIIALLIIDLLLLVSLGIFIGKSISKLWAEARSGAAGSKLHARIVSIFSLIAIIPVIVMALFSSLFFYFAIHSWFDEKVKTAITESNNVAEYYLQEHQRNIKTDLLLMAREINMQTTSLFSGNDYTQTLLRNLASIYNLNEVVIFDRSGNVYGWYGLMYSFDFNLFGPDAYDRALKGEIILKPDDITAYQVTEKDNRMWAMIKLDRFVDGFLIISRNVDHRVLKSIEETQRASSEYLKLDEVRTQIEVIGVVLYTVVSLLMLMSAIWLGLHFARRLMKPMTNLIEAAEKVSQGQLSVHVEEEEDSAEFRVLIHTFNDMVLNVKNLLKKLDQQNAELNQKSIFMETVLSGVSSGVISLDSEFCIKLMNKAAYELLGTQKRKKNSFIGTQISNLIEPLSVFLDQIRMNPEKSAKGQLKYLDPEGVSKTFVFLISTEFQKNIVMGYVLTMHDISDLVFAQRKAAWSEVARRIAHEIKNPLTPIQLSAERLKRRYEKQISEDVEAFSFCIETIVRQVDQIGKMIDEFSAFARMPTPKFAQIKLSTLFRQALFLQQQAHPYISFESNIIDRDIYCDSGQIDQVLKNLVQNAIDAIDMKTEELKQSVTKNLQDYKGIIKIDLEEIDASVRISIQDNGIGIKDYTTDQLIEPYVTTKEKGTGLGLAIVKKIIEDHAGSFTLKPRKQGGVQVQFTLPVDPRLL